MDRISGYVDGMTDRAVIGWVVNHDDPQALEQIVCHGGEGGARHFSSFYHRLDVCRALDLPGKFGFAIPLSALRGLGPIVSLTDRNGVAFDGAASIDLPRAMAARSVHEGEAQAAAVDSPVHILLHIQKTAGTSLRASIAAGMSYAETVFLYPDGVSGLRPDELNRLPFHQRRCIRFAMGHSYFGIDKYIPRRAEYITILRDPLSRLVSHYHHHHAAGSRMMIDGVQAGIADIITGGLSEEFDNLMTRVIAGVATDAVPIGEIGEKDVELALHNIRTAFRFIGRTDRLDEDFPELCNVLGIQHRPLGVLNATCLAEAAHPVGAAWDIDWHAVMQRNRWDQLLYRRVQEAGLCGRDLARH